MAAKIVRQPNKIALLGSPTSAAATTAGREGAPAALRAAGLIDRLQAVGYQVSDLGDDPPQVYKSDEESPRARNVSGVLASLEALKPRVEQAVKSLALPLILSGDSSAALATIAGVRRYFRHVGMIYMSGTADLLTPATTTSGSVDGMVASHIIGRGAAELVRFWGEPPLIREPDLAIFGAGQIKPAEEEVFRQSTMRRYVAADMARTGAANAAQTAVDRVHGNGNEFILHLGVNVIADFQATDDPNPDGLHIDQVRETLEIFFTQKHLAAVEVTGYSPAKDSDGSGAKLIVDLLAGALAKRFEALPLAAPPISDKKSVKEPAISVAPPIAPGEAWSSESLEDEPAVEEASSEDGSSDNPSESSAGADDSHS